MRCAEILVREGPDSASNYGKILENIKQFENLRISPIDLRFLESHKSSSAKTFIAKNPVIISVIWSWKEHKEHKSAQKKAIVMTTCCL